MIVPKGTVIRPRIAVILAAGRGTRMRSDRPKVVHQVAGRPMICWVLDAARGAGCEEAVVVVSPAERGGDEIRAALAEGMGQSHGARMTFVVQNEALGTGHALLQTETAVKRSMERAPEGAQATLVVLSGDTPLISAETVHQIATAGEGAWGALAVARLDRPGDLGRVVTRADGTFERIVEASDANADERALCRINAGIYAFSAPAIFEDLSRLGSANAQAEIYLTDAPGSAAERGEKVVLVELEDPREALGVNTPTELARVRRLLAARRVAGKESRDVRDRGLRR